MIAVTVLIAVLQVARSALVGIGGEQADVVFHMLATPTGPICNLDCEYCFFFSNQMLYPDDRFSRRLRRRLVLLHGGRLGCRVCGADCDLDIHTGCSECA